MFGAGAQQRGILPLGHGLLRDVHSENHSRLLLNDGTAALALLLIVVGKVRKHQSFHEGARGTCGIAEVDGRTNDNHVGLACLFQYGPQRVLDGTNAIGLGILQLAGKAAAAAVEVDVKDLYIMYNKKIPVNIECGFRVALEVMGGKWKPYIIYELVGGHRRPSQLQKAIPEASNRVLTQQLRELLQYGVVERKVVDPVCKHSEYSLTPLGKSLIPIIDQMREWGNNFRPRLEEILKEKNE